MKKIYSDDELFCNNEQKAYSGDAGCVDFLLGGSEPEMFPWSQRKSYNLADF